MGVTLLVFAIVTAIFETILLMNLVSLKTLQKRFVQITIHGLVITINIIATLGSVVGMMSGMLAGLISFMIVPLVIILKTFWKNYQT